MLKDPDTPFKRIKRGIFYGLILLATSCFTRGESHFPIEEYNKFEPISFSYNDISITITPLDPDFLSRKHGLDEDFFVSYPGIFPPKNSMVFQLSLLSESSSVTVDYENSTLQSWTGEVIFPKTRETFYTLWEDKISSSRKGRLAWLTEQYLLKESSRLRIGHGESGYLIFHMDSLRRGDFLFNLPLDIEGNESGILSIPITLEIDDIAAERAIPGDQPYFTIKE